MEKCTIRTHVLTALTEQDRTTKARLDALLLADLTATDEYQSACTLATYMALPHEFDTSLVIRRALADGKRVLIPRTRKTDRSMQMCAYDPENLTRTSFGLLEPSLDAPAVPLNEIDLIHVPAVAVNTGGYRIGYGAGYYDRFLASYTGSTLITAYRDIQLVEFSPEDFDVPAMRLLMR
ncbi:5-formyltetrahydrofolate cyclo-ligase [Alloscardovia macacae]|uniref:5-formyltetrahydrofolate cyclo-ligase n=1 Tax=Alloscardovia macacae TaxID=1160091 RepID=A0A261F5H1_9BIFI|nr:5-formyltetrahydrofolate cyclo-ligase [Alloscardovia macacae]OZG54399.1 5-formyltetrahydrofolate cyclo-ligase [Alloscardovia macacae]